MDRIDSRPDSELEAPPRTRLSCRVFRNRWILNPKSRIPLTLEFHMIKPDFSKFELIWRKNFVYLRRQVLKESQFFSELIGILYVGSIIKSLKKRFLRAKTDNFRFWKSGILRALRSARNWPSLKSVNPIFQISPWVPLLQALELGFSLPYLQGKRFLYPLGVRMLSTFEPLPREKPELLRAEVPGLGSNYNR